MSRVFWPSTGMRASTSPGDRSCPSRIWISAPTCKPMVTGGRCRGSSLRLPPASSSLTCGRTTLPRRGASGRSPPAVDRPVTSSTCLATVTPSTTFSNFALPGELGDDRAGQRVPVGQHGAGLDLLVGLDVERRRTAPWWRSRSRPVRVGDDDLARTRDDHQLALAVGDVAHRGVEADQRRRTWLRRWTPPPPRAGAPRCGRSAWSAACPARRSTARRSRPTASPMLTRPPRPRSRP